MPYRPNLNPYFDFIWIKFYDLKFYSGAWPLKLFKGKTNELVGFGIHVNFELSHDGSGKGAALVSAVSGRRHLPEVGFWSKWDDPERQFSS